LRSTPGRAHPPPSDTHGLPGRWVCPSAPRRARPAGPTTDGPAESAPRVPDRIVGTWSRGISDRSSSPNLPGCRRSEQWRIRVNEPPGPSIPGARPGSPSVRGATPEVHAGRTEWTRPMAGTTHATMANLWIAW
jgi:hypothetical protein